MAGLRRGEYQQQRIINRFDIVLALMVLGLVLDLAQSILAWLGA